MKYFNEKTGLEFLYVGDESYVRKDGVEVTLHLWQSNCRRCGNEFVDKTAKLPGDESFKLELIHCKDHRMTREQINKKANDMKSVYRQIKQINKELQQARE